MRLAVVLISAVATASSAVHAQTWTADLYAGGARYQALTDRVSTTNLIGNLRYQTARGSVGYISAAAPLDGDAAVWGAAGVVARFLRYTLGMWSYGIELGTHGYGFRDPADNDLYGGASLHALPLMALTHRVGTLELRSGWHQHAFSYSDTTGARGLFEAGARTQAAAANAVVQLDARWLAGAGTSYPYIGAQVATAPSIVRLSGWVGRWFADTLDDVTWGVGANIPIGRSAEVWGSFRRDAGDPLFESTGRRSWNIGISHQLGRPPGPPPELAPKVARGAVQLRLPTSSIQDANGAPPSVAGEFNDWTPAPMRLAGGVWVLDLPLGPGVYRFAFVTAQGEWFVPEAYPGRRDDGMGGFVAVIVVP